MMKTPLLVIACALLAAPTVAHADAKTEARSHIDRATTLHQQNKFTEALHELLLAYSLDPQPGLLYAIAQVNVKLGNCAQAITFYERFLTTHPSEGPEASARAAIATCQANPPAVAPPPEPVPDVVPPVEVKPVDVPPPPAPSTPRSGTTPFYTDLLGDALTAGGVAVGVVSLVLYGSARTDLDAAETAVDYAASQELVDRAHRKRTFAIVTGVGGVALIGAGLARYLLHDRGIETPAVAVLPLAGGGVVSWTGSFR
ncbi:MAG: hypothetical protein NT062_10670 [Proteobacteria bacterium]|nr:hypothetical protein [Pseudomonadota bacterium]